MEVRERDRKTVPIWEKYMLTVDEAVQYFGIGEKKIRMLIAENINTDYCFTVQIGNKSLINRQKFENFLNQTTSLSYCSNMAKSGMNPKTLQYLMGHSDIGITLNTYTHLGLDDAREELERISRLA